MDLVHIAACNIDRARESAKTPMPGGWHAENSTSEFISQLYDSAARLAAVRRGIVREAYAQVHVQQSVITCLLVFLLYRLGLPM